MYSDEDGGELARDRRSQAELFGTEKVENHPDELKWPGCLHLGILRSPPRARVLREAGSALTHHRSSLRIVSDMAGITGPSSKTAVTRAAISRLRARGSWKLPLRIESDGRLESR